jgi:antibiotic biosynthesis monooxygenase (ABM) superfamily enzyme
MNGERNDFLKNSQGLSIWFTSDAPAQWKQAIKVSIYRLSDVYRGVVSGGTGMMFRNAHNFNRS